MVALGDEKRLEETDRRSYSLVAMDPRAMEIERSSSREEREHYADEVEVKSKLGKRSWVESKKMWEIAAPCILTGVAQFSIGLVTVAFVGHLGSVELAAVSVVQNVIEGFVYGVMVLLHIPCRLQRSFIITLFTACLLTPFYVFASPLLKLLRQNKDISELAGKYATWAIPQLFAYALNFPVQKFLQAQSKIWVMTVINIVALAFHAVLNWVFVTKYRKGLVGAAIVGNITWWLVVVAQIVYVVAGFFPKAWTGFSLKAFKSLSGFVKLSLASDYCVNQWQLRVVVLHRRDPHGWLVKES